MADYEPRDGRIADAKSSTPVWLWVLIIVIVMVIAAFALGLVNVDQTKTAKLPDVTLQTSGGQAPAFDVNTAKIDVGTKTETVEVPTIRVEKAETKP